MFCDKLKELRINANLTQDELAIKLSVSRSAVAKWEQGRGIPNKESLQDICNLFNITENDLFTYNDLEKNIKENHKINRLKTILIIIVSSIAIMLLSSCIYLRIYNKKMQNVIIENGYFNEKYLKNIGLVDMPRINKKINAKEYDVYYNNDDEDYITTIDNIDSFEQYATRIFNYLKNNPYISNIYYPCKYPEANYYNKDTGIKTKCDNKYLISYDEKESYKEINGDIMESYVFYFFKPLNVNRNLYTSLDPYVLSISYISNEHTGPLVYFNTKKGEKKEAYGNFILSIYKDTSLHNKFSETYNDETTIHYDNDNYYMASDSYELNKDTIDEVALFNQFSLKTDENSLTISYKDEYYFIKYYILARITFSYIDENNTTIKAKRVINVSNEKEVEIPFSEYKNVHFIELQVIDGYAYSLIRKENAKEPYIDSKIYL
ncbi:MAG: helix-turn-helix transcriptional regulator [Candidatus Caccosoma sp.]|nr:helix-turn-helix transcriptional regulator [Candidatus Caccosoma sp.]